MSEVRHPWAQVEGLLGRDFTIRTDVRFTPRERQVLGLMSQGLNNKDIAKELGLSEGVVKVYNSRLFGKCPALGGRHGAIKFVARDHERKMAIRLNEWIAAHGEGLSPEAHADIKGIMADMVAKVLQ